MTAPDIASLVALRVAVCSRMIEPDPTARMSRQIIEAMRRRVAAECEAAVRMHDEAFPRTPYKSHA
jgi:hypothetical protein